MKLCLCILVSFLGMITPVFSQVIQDCANGMNFNECGTACPLTCDNYQNAPLPCTRQCMVGCFCPQGLVQHNGGCIQPSECQVSATTMAPSSSPPTCLNGMVHMSCGTACPLTCDNYESPPLFCTYQCVSGCFCPSGLLQHNERCVTPSECPSLVVSTTPAPLPTCNNGMEFNHCGTACPLTCGNYQEVPLPCTRQCVAGCFCPWWMVQHDGGCIVHTECPGTSTTVHPDAIESTALSCPNGMIFADRCGRECEIITSCDNYQNRAFCDFHCEQNCYCPDGMVEHNGECVDPSMCPESTPSIETTQPSCPNGMIFADRCGRECEIVTSCDNYQNIAFCDFHCEQNCYCPDGMVEHNGECVDPSMCPAVTETTPSVGTTQPSCPSGMIFADRCGRECEIVTSCDNYQNRAFCDFHCEQNCYCPDGMVEHNGECVEPSMCPESSISTPSIGTTQPSCPNGMIFADRCGRECEIVTSCDNYQNRAFCDFHCEQNCYCPDGMVEHNGECVEPSVCPESTPSMGTTQPSCPNGMTFADRCGRECEIVASCDNYHNITFCDFHCEQNCYCPDGMVEHSGECVDPVTCPDARKRCLHGKEYRECGPICPETCDTVNGFSPCFSLRCGSPGCYCPSGTVLYQGRCIDPSQCPTPPTSSDPSLPSIDTNKILLTMNSRGQEHEDFQNQQQLFLDAIERILNARGFPNVAATLHTVYVEGHLKIVIQLSGDITDDDATQLAALLNTHLHMLPFPVDQVSVTKLPEEGSDNSLSEAAVAAISGVSSFVVLMVLFLTLAMVVCYVSRKRQTVIPRGQVYAYTPLNDECGKQQSKLVKESLW